MKPRQKKKVKLNFFIDEEVAEKFRRFSKEMGVPQCQLMGEAINDIKKKYERFLLSRQKKSDVDRQETSP